MKVIYFTIFSIVVSLFASCESSTTNELYNHKYRPQLHFSPKSNWMNDPNGMVYYHGEYHLFFQHNPDDQVWGPMHWGHAVSKDLIHWEELPIALFPDDLGWIFSGSAVVDINNTSGLGENSSDPLIAIYTYHNPKLEKEGSDQFQYQGIAYSNDDGRTWTKYLGNPVLANPGIKDFRDPKVFWNEEKSKWNMVLAAKDHVNIYSSPNLLDWEFESEFGNTIGSHSGVWECPDLFQLEVENSDEKKWVMIVSVGSGAPNGGSGTQYFVGDFDGSTFDCDYSKPTWVDYGKDNYAGVSWNNGPKDDNRRIFLGWLNNWQYANDIPTENWRGSATLPRELSLIKRGHTYLIKSKIVDEYSVLKNEPLKIPSMILEGKQKIKKELELPLEIDLDFDTSNNSSMEFSKNFGVKLSNDLGEQVMIGYDNYNKVFYIDNTKNGWDNPANDFAQVNYAPYVVNENKTSFKLIIDTSSLEFFAVDGLVSMTNQFFPSKPFTEIELYSERGKIEMISGKIVPLNSIWKKID
jgi:fructan beta-fructosidase